MATHDTATLSKLSDTAQTVASADEDIRGRTVKDKDGHDIGKVDDLLIDDRERKVRFIQVEAGGFLGLGETKSFIPVDAITRITDHDVSIGQSKEHMAGAPRYDPALVADQDYYGNLSGYYGYAPYWDPGYSYPPYPYLPIAPA